jgi:hypothetical protein
MHIASDALCKYCFTENRENIIHFADRTEMADWSGLYRQQSDITPTRGKVSWLGAGELGMVLQESTHSQADCKILARPDAFASAVTKSFCVSTAAKRSMAIR